MDELLASIAAQKELLDKSRPLPRHALAQLEDGAVVPASAAMKVTVDSSADPKLESKR
jgi:hypothetical protein